MKALPSAFTLDGFAFRQIARRGDVALFAKRKPRHCRDTFEVVIVQRHAAKNIMGRDYPERESMPPSESWGVAGWSHADLESARRKFHELARERDFPHTPSAVGAFLTANRLGAAAV